MAEFTSGAAGGLVVAVLTRKLTQSPLVEAGVNGAKEAFSLVPAETDRSRAGAGDAQLGAVVAFGFVFARLRIRALARCSIAN